MKKKILFTAISSIATLAPIAFSVAAVEKNEIIKSINSKKNDKNFGYGNHADKSKIFKSNFLRNEFYTRQKTGKPFSLHYHIEDLPNWSKEKDADQLFNIPTIPLQKREKAFDFFKRPANELALDIYGVWSKHTSDTLTGTNDLYYDRNNIFSFWNNIGRAVSWGGSAGEGQIILPKAEDTNAAHKNGVKMYGVLFLAPNVYGGDSSDYNKLAFTKDGGKTFPNADKLLEISKTYKFDGWFLNLETSFSGDWNMFVKFAEYLYKISKDSGKEIILYNYNVGGRLMKNFNSIANQASIDFSYNFYNFIDNKYQSKGYNLSSFNFDKSWNKNRWIYSYFRNNTNIINGEKDIMKYWGSNDANYDPRIKGGKFNWASHYNQTTTLTKRERFSTQFNLGFGKEYNVDGKNYKKSSLFKNGWRNQGLQSYLPTWRYIVEKYKLMFNLFDQKGIAQIKGPLNREKGIVTSVNDDENKFHVSIEKYDKAQNGGTALHYSGEFRRNYIMSNPLFSMNFKFKKGDKFSILSSYKDNQYLTINFKDGNGNNKHTFISGKAVKISDDLYKIEFEIPEETIGTDINWVGLGIKGSGKKSSIYISQFDYIPVDYKDDKESGKIISFTNRGAFGSDESKNIRVSWKTKDDSNNSKYIIFESDSNYKIKKLLNISAIPAAILEGVKSKNIVIFSVNSKDNQLVRNNIKLENI